MMDKYWESEIEGGRIAAFPRSGKCMFCGNVLTAADKDHSVCNPCWDKTFAHKFIADKEDGFCIDCGEEEETDNHKNWNRDHAYYDPYEGVAFDLVEPEHDDTIYTDIESDLYDVR